jgi:hypothetical protein
VSEGTGSGSDGNILGSEGSERETQVPLLAS